MGSFYTIKEAAGRLGKSSRMVYMYIEKGLLGRYSNNGKVAVKQDEVEQLAEELASNFPVVNRRTVFLLTSRISKLENEVSTLKAVLELRNEMADKPTDLTAPTLYRGVLEALTRRGSWSQEEVQFWSKQFANVDEIWLEAICSALQNHKAWVPVLQLVTSIHEYAEVKNNEKPDVGWQMLEAGLRVGKNKVRNSVLIFIESGKGASTETLLSISETPTDAILTKLRHQ